MSVQLSPMEFILERGSGRKFNDPLLDKYVGAKMLSPELSNVPVPVLLLPRLRTPMPSLHVVGQGMRAPDGKWAVAAPGAQTEQTIVKVPPTISKPSVTAMSIEEARKRGFIGRVKLVDDSYGAAETDGAPQRGDAIPRIKYAMESQAPLARTAALPQELLDQVNPSIAPLIEGLTKAAQDDPESVSLSRRAAEKAVAEQQGSEGVKNFRAEVKQIRSKPKLPSATFPSTVAHSVADSAPAAVADSPTVHGTHPVAMIQPRRRIAHAVSASVEATQPLTAEDEPVIEPALPPEPNDESPLMGGRPSEFPQPLLEQEDTSDLTPTPEDRASGGTAIRCNACGKEFQYKSYYKRHVLRAHKDRITELLPAEHP